MLLFAFRIRFMGTDMTLMTTMLFALIWGGGGLIWLVGIAMESVKNPIKVFKGSFLNFVLFFLIWFLGMYGGVFLIMDNELAIF